MTDLCQGAASSYWLMDAGQAPAVLRRLRQPTATWLSYLGGEMPQIKSFDRALAAIARAEVTLEDLEANCCEPGRSPRMASLAETLSSVRDGIHELDPDSGSASGVIARLEDAGAQIGSLQIGCCAPSRLPLYATMLKELTGAQRSINQALGRGH